MRGRNAAGVWSVLLTRFSYQGMVVRQHLNLRGTHYYADMRMDDPIPTFAYFITQLKEVHPDLAYLHVVEDRFDEGLIVPEIEKVSKSNPLSDHFTLRKFCLPRPTTSFVKYGSRVLLSVPLDILQSWL